jgi:hypothetical protein
VLIVIGLHHQGKQNKDDGDKGNDHLLAFHLTPRLLGAERSAHSS